MAYQPLTNPPSDAQGSTTNVVVVNPTPPQYTPSPQYQGAGVTGGYQPPMGAPMAGGMPGMPYNPNPQAMPMYQPQMGPNQAVVAVAMPNPGVAEVNMVWVQQQVDNTSCYIKVLATLIIADAIYSLAVSSQSMYTTAWDIVVGVITLGVGLLGLAAGITNRTNLTRIYFWALVGLTIFLTIGYIIVLAVIGGNPCKGVDDGSNSNDNNNGNKVCQYSVDTIRAIIIIAALIVIACCACCTFCARMHLKNLELRDNQGVMRM